MGDLLQSGAGIPGPEGVGDPAKEPSLVREKEPGGDPMNDLECKESIAYLWGYPHAIYPRKPTTLELFEAITREVEACLHSTDWETRIRRIENILSVIKCRMEMFRQEQLLSDIDKLVKELKECDTHVG